MEQEQQINIAALLKDCPKGTKLYSPICGECEFVGLEYTDISIYYPGSGWLLNQYGHLPDDTKLEGECLLFPSKEVRDWGCFRVKYMKMPPNMMTLGDVREVDRIFKENGGKKVSKNLTAVENAVWYIDAISKEIKMTLSNPNRAYILSTGTELKLEEEQPKFKVGDVVATKEHTTIGMVERLVCEGAFVNYSGESTTTFRIDELRLATPEEIDRWNKETLEPNHLHYSMSKRRIIHWFVEYDRVVVKDDDEDNMWKSRQFDYYHLFPDKKRPYHCQDDMYYKQCLPYNEKTAKLIGTTDVYTEEK